VVALPRADDVDGLPAGAPARQARRHRARLDPGGGGVLKFCTLAERTPGSGLRLEVNKLFYVVPTQAVVARWPGAFQGPPPRQELACFNVGAPMEQLTAPQGPGE
jgi:hypothetical protein